MFDTHCHLNFSAFENNLEDVVNEAKNKGVNFFVVPGTDIETSKKAVKIAQKYQGVFAAVGIHPHHIFQIKDYSLEKIKNHLLEEIEKLIKQEKVVAVGEIGLDRYIYQKTKYESYQINEEFVNLQKFFFTEQLKLGAKYQKTVIIHNRQAKADLLEILNSNKKLVANSKMVFHCCEADEALLDFAKKNHIFIGVDGDVTYDQKKQEFVKNVPLEMLVIETDSPFLTPTPLRDNPKTKFPNTPKNLLIITQKIAEIKNVNIDKIKKITFKNSLELFNL
ncbi:MAG: TatD family hydrolase [Microgenomates group bacterium]